MIRREWLLSAGRRALLTAGLKAVLATGALLPVCAATVWSSGAREVAIDNFAFSPATLTVAPGMAVTWTNDDDIPHSIVLTDGSARSKALDSGDTFSYRFDRAGSYSYICGLHPHMRGTVVVR